MKRQNKDERPNARDAFTRTHKLGKRSASRRAKRWESEPRK